VQRWLHSRRVPASIFRIPFHEGAIVCLIGLATFLRGTQRLAVTDGPAELPTTITATLLMVLKAANESRRVNASPGRLASQSRPAPSGLFQDGKLECAGMRSWLHQHLLDWSKIDGDTGAFSSGQRSKRASFVKGWEVTLKVVASCMPHAVCGVVYLGGIWLGPAVHTLWTRSTRLSRVPVVWSYMYNSTTTTTVTNNSAVYHCNPLPKRRRPRYND